MADVPLTQKEQKILEKMREEVAAGRMTEEEVDFVQSAFKLYSSMRVFSGFLIKLAAVLVAIQTALSVWPRKS